MVKEMFEKSFPESTFLNFWLWKIEINAPSEIIIYDHDMENINKSQSSFLLWPQAINLIKKKLNIAIVMIALFFGSRYEGEVKDTIRYGKGILYSKNEDWVVGEFMNYLNGPAIYHYADGYLRAPNFSFLKNRWYNLNLNKNLGINISINE